MGFNSGFKGLKNERICVLSLIEEHEVDLHSVGGGLMVTNGGTVGFPQHKQLSRSTADFAVSNSRRNC